MKTTHILPLAIAAIGFSASAASAHGNLQQHSITAKFTVNVQVDNDSVTKNNDDVIDSGEIVSTKYSNKEILQVLVEEGTIDADSIKGWKLVFISYNGVYYDTYAFNTKTSEQVDISDWLNLYTEVEEIDYRDDSDGASYSYKGKSDYSENRYTESGIYKSKAYAYLSYFDGLGYNDLNEYATEGLFTGKYTYDSDYGYYDLVSGTFEQLTGEFEYDGDYAGVISGAADIGKGSIFEWIVS